MGVVTQAATIKVAMDGTSCQGDGGFIGIGIVDVTFGRAAIHVTIHVDTRAVDGNCDVAIGGSAVTIAAAEDAVIAVGVVGTNGAASNVDEDIACDSTASVAATIETTEDCTARHDHIATGYASFVAAAVNTACDGTIDDVHIGCAAIRSFVAATKHVGDSHVLGDSGIIDNDLNRVLRCAVEVVATKHVGDRATQRLDFYISVYLSLDGVATFSSQATAIYITDSATRQRNNGAIACACTYVG